MPNPTPPVAIPLPPNLPPYRASTSADRLNARLADLVDLHLQSRLALWALGAPDFRLWHPLCDNVERQFDDSAGALAHRVAQLGARPFAVTRPVAWPRSPASARPFAARMRNLTRLLARFHASLRRDLCAATSTSDDESARVLAAAATTAGKILRLLQAHFDPPMTARPFGRSWRSPLRCQLRIILERTSCALFALPA